MKIKKRYIVACVLMCVLSIVLSVAIFYIEMNLASFSKLNNALSDWRSTTVFVTSTAKEGDEVDLEFPFNYIGSKSVILSGKYDAFGADGYANDGIAVADEVKLGDRVEIYFKPDDPRTIAVKVPVLPYLIVVIALFVLDIMLVVASLILSRKLKENTFSDAKVTIMNIPIAVLIIGIIIGFFSGMLIGQLSVGTKYTSINPIIAEQYETHELIWTQWS
ncbi:MAG: hypothetical protein ACI4KF_09260 [Huintestinicola sp.]